MVLLAEKRHLYLILMIISYISHRDFIDGHSSYWWTKVAESHLEKLQMILCISDRILYYHIYYCLYPPLIIAQIAPIEIWWQLLNTIEGSSCWETTNLVLILGSTVNDNTGSEGLSCQSEVIGLLIVLQNKRRLSRCVCLPLLATAHSDIDNTTNAKHCCLNDLDNDQLMEHF